MEDLKQRFHRYFQVESSRLQELIAELHTISTIGGERQDAMEHVLVAISRLSQDVADAADYVPPYDQRTYSQSVKNLSELLEAEQAKFAPKRRFQFKPRSSEASVADSSKDTRRNVPVDGTNDTPKSEASPNDSSGDKVGTLPTFPTRNYNDEISSARGVRKPSFSAARDIMLSGHSGIHIILPASASRATSSGTVTDIHGCIVDMSAPTGETGAPFANLALKNITGSLIVAGNVDGPVHITGVRDSKLVLVARQVRIHECENVDLYLHCLSHPIIEDCKGMRFAPAPKCYLSGQQDQKTNQWDQVDDFKWLKTEPSPNWSILSESERIEDDRWLDTVHGHPGEGPQDILKKLGIDPCASKA